MLTDQTGDLALSAVLPAVKRAAGAVTRLVPIPQPTMMVGPGSSGRLGQSVALLGHRKVLVVTDAVITRLGLARPLLDALSEGGTGFVVFDEVTPDAPIPLVEKGIEVFRREGCDAIVAFGGGSVMDAAKVIGAAAANGRSPRDLVGYFRGWKPPAPLYAVPTTAGTGSEVTVAAVISDPENGTKLVVADTRLVPRMAALDPALMTGLPPQITAATGMDALTHAVEAYIGHWGTDFSDRMALAAVSTIYENLPVAYAKGGDLVAREKMALASTWAGLAFTRASVGNVHALAHQIGGRYHTPHGLANAIVLPQVLRFSAAEAEGKLAELAVRAGVASREEPEAARAERFLSSVEELNESLGIPRHLEALRKEDVPDLARAACREADANYPVPRRMTRADAERLLLALVPEEAPVPSAEPEERRAAPARTAARKPAERKGGPRRRSAAT